MCRCTANVTEGYTRKKNDKKGNETHGGKIKRKKEIIERNS